MDDNIFASRKISDVILTLIRFDPSLTIHGAFLKLMDVIMKHTSPETFVDGCNNWFGKGNYFSVNSDIIIASIFGLEHVTSNHQVIQNSGQSFTFQRTSKIYGIAAGLLLWLVVDERDPVMVNVKKTLDSPSSRGDESLLAAGDLDIPLRPFWFAERNGVWYEVYETPSGSIPPPSFDRDLASIAHITAFLMWSGSNPPKSIKPYYLAGMVKPTITGFEPDIHSQKGWGAAPVYEERFTDPKKKGDPTPKEKMESYKAHYAAAVTILLALKDTRVTIANYLEAPFYVFDFSEKSGASGSAQLRFEYEKHFVTHFGTSTGPIETISEIGGELPYEAGMGFARPIDPKIKGKDKSSHNGQKKLGIHEIQFLNGCEHGAVVVYAGAAPNHKGAFIASMFPDITFVLVDPAPFLIKNARDYGVVVKTLWARPDPTDRKGRSGQVPNIPSTADEKQKALDPIKGPGIYIIQDFFDANLAIALCRKFGSYDFISDIRTNADDGGKEPGTSDVVWNLAQTLGWFNAMKSTNFPPKRAVVKWRYPFYDEDLTQVLRECNEPMRKPDFDLAKKIGVDFLAALPRKHIEFYDGVVFLQAFPGPSSTEARLLITDFDNVVDHGHVSHYENKFAYYNNIERHYVLHHHPYQSSLLGIDACNDCAIMVTVLEAYVMQDTRRTRWNSTNGSKPADKNAVINMVHALVDEFTKVTDRDLFIGGHGHFFTPRSPGDLAKILVDNIESPPPSASFSQGRGNAPFRGGARVSFRGGRGRGQPSSRTYEMKPN